MKIGKRPTLKTFKSRMNKKLPDSERHRNRQNHDENDHVNSTQMKHKELMNFTLLQ